MFCHNLEKAVDTYVGSGAALSRSEMEVKADCSRRTSCQLTGITLNQEADRSVLQSAVSIKSQETRQVEKRTASFQCCSSLEIGFRLLQASTLFSELSL